MSEEPASRVSNADSFHPHSFQSVPGWNRYYQRPSSESQSSLSMLILLRARSRREGTGLRRDRTFRSQIPHRLNAVKRQSGGNRRNGESVDAFKCESMITTDVPRLERMPAESSPLHRVPRNDWERLVRMNSAGRGEYAKFARFMKSPRLHETALSRKEGLSKSRHGQPQAARALSHSEDDSWVQPCRARN